MSEQISKISYQLLPGPVGKLLEGTYSTTARVPISHSCSLVYTTGHVGLDLESGKLVSSSLKAEFEAIFRCLDTALKNAGVQKGCGGAFKFTSYLSSADCEATMQAVFKTRWPGHYPTWTTVLVTEIAGASHMHAEISAEAAAFH